MKLLRTSRNYELSRYLLKWRIFSWRPTLFDIGFAQTSIVFFVTLVFANPLDRPSIYGGWKEKSDLPSTHFHHKMVSRKTLLYGKYRFIISLAPLSISAAASSTDSSPAMISSQAGRITSELISLRPGRLA